MCKTLNIAYDVFEQKYLDLTANDIYLKSPCPFLKENLCTVYEFRPQTCRDFPFRPDFSIAIINCHMGLKIFKKICNFRLTKILSTKNLPEEIKKEIPPEIILTEGEETQEKYKHQIEMGKSLIKAAQNNIDTKLPPATSEKEESIFAVPVAVLRALLEQLRNEKTRNFD